MEWILTNDDVYNGNFARTVKILAELDTKPDTHGLVDLQALKKFAIEIIACWDEIDRLKE